MSDIDPIKFGEMCGYVKATHETVCKMDTDFKEHRTKVEDDIDEACDRIKDLENRNENIKQNWKKAGWLTASVGAIVGVFKAFFSLFT